MRLQESIVIDAPAPIVYRTISDIEGHVRILPGYEESRIIAENGDAKIVQREAVIAGKRRRWKSEVRLEDGSAVRFRQVEGPMAGMEVGWYLEPDQFGSRLTIVHELHLQPRWKGWWYERWIARPAIERTAHIVLEAIKSFVEMGGHRV